MNSSVDYFRVGLFVIALIALGVALTLWLMVERDDESSSNYVAHMTEAVSGLSVLAPVKLNGVQVGTVSSIALDPDDPSRVRIVMSIADTAPLTADTVAVLDSQGITGIAFVQLTGGTRESPPLPRPVGDSLPEIPTGPSLFVRMDESVSRLMTEMTEVARHLQAVSEGLTAALAPDNLATASRILANTERLTASLVSNSGAFEASLADLRSLLARLQASVSGLPSLSAELERTVRSLEATAASVGGAAERFGALAGASERGLEQVSGHTLPAVNRLVNDTHALVSRAEEIIRAIEQRPSVVLFGNDVRPGPGE